VVVQCQAADEQLMKLQEESLGDIDYWKAALEKKSAVQNALKERVQENSTQRKVSI